MKIELSLKEITWLGKRYDGKTFVSPYSYIQEEGFTDEDKQMLVDKNIIDEKGNLNKDVEPLLNLLSIVKNYTIFKYSNGLIKSEKIVFFTGKNTISAVTRNDVMHLEMPADNGMIIDLIHEMTGKSDATASDLDLETDYKTAIIFAVILDICRSNIMRAYSSFTNAQITGIAKSEIIKMVNDNVVNGQKLSSLIAGKTDQKIEISESELDKSIKELIEKELVLSNDGKIFLTGDGLLFGGAFLTIENYYNFIIGEEKNGELYKADLDIIQAGIRDILLIESSENEKISLKAISASGLCQIAEKILSEKADIAG